MKFKFTDATIAGIQLFLFIQLSIYWEHVANGGVPEFFFISILGIAAYKDHKPHSMFMIFFIAGHLILSIYGFKDTETVMIYHTLLGCLIATLPFGLRAVFWKQLLISSVTMFTSWEKVRSMRNTIYNRGNDRKAIRKLYSAYFDNIMISNYDQLEKNWSKIYEISRSSASELFDQSDMLIKLLNSLKTYIPSEDFKARQFLKFKKELEEISAILIFFCVNNYKQELKLGMKTILVMKEILDQDVENIIFNKAQELYLKHYTRDQFKEFAFGLSSLILEHELFDFMNECRERERKHKTLNFLILQGDLERICHLIKKDELKTPLSHDDMVLLKKFHTLPSLYDADENSVSYNASVVKQVRNDLNFLYKNTSINWIETKFFIKDWFNEFIEPLVIAKQSNNKSLTKIVALISSGLHEDLANLENVKYLRNIEPVPEVK